MAPHMIHTMTYMTELDEDRFSCPKRNQPKMRQNLKKERTCRVYVVLFTLKRQKADTYDSN